MLEAIPNIILKDTEYRVTSNYRVIKQDTDFKVIFGVTDNISFILYKDGYYELWDNNRFELLLEGQSTSPLHKSWINRMIKAGYSEIYAYNEFLEWKNINRSK